jgi:hypothetical protein
MREEATSDEFVINSTECLSFYGPTLVANNKRMGGARELERAVESPTALASNSSGGVGSKRHLEKYHVLKEILSSEKKYLNDLSEIVEGYYEELDSYYQKSSQLENRESISGQIFSNIKEIFEFTK